MKDGGPSRTGWREALARFMAENDRRHRALPAGWRARLDALFFHFSERDAASSAERRRQRWQDYEKS